MIDSFLMEIIVCPETKQPLKMADEAQIIRCNELVASGTLRNRAGERVLEPFEEGLIREDGKIIYPVRHGVPILLIEEGIETA